MSKWSDTRVAPVPELQEGRANERARRLHDLRVRWMRQLEWRQVSEDGPKGSDKDERPTVRLDASGMKPSWPIVVASLEQLADWAVLALRLGTLTLIQNCVRELAQSDARIEHVARLRELVDALAHMPFEA